MRRFTRLSSLQGICCCGEISATGTEFYMPLSSNFRRRHSVERCSKALSCMVQRYLDPDLMVLMPCFSRSPAAYRGTTLGNCWGNFQGRAAALSDRCERSCAIRMLSTLTRVSDGGFMVGNRSTCLIWQRWLTVTVALQPSAIYSTSKQKILFSGPPAIHSSLLAHVDSSYSRFLF